MRFRLFYLMLFWGIFPNLVFSRSKDSVKIDSIAVNSSKIDTGHASITEWGLKDLQKFYDLGILLYGNRDLFKRFINEYPNLLDINGKYLYIGLHFQKLNSLEIGIEKGHRSLMEFWKYSGKRLSFQIGSRNQLMHYGLKYGYTKSGAFFTYGFDVGALRNKLTPGLIYFQPQIGITSMGTWSLTYGYNFVASRSNDLPISAHTISLRYSNNRPIRNGTLKIKSASRILLRDYERLKQMGIDITQLF